MYVKFKTSKFLSRQKHENRVAFHTSVTLIYANLRCHNNMKVIVGITEVKSRRGSKENISIE